MTFASLRQLFGYTVPVFMGYAPLGLVFGFLLVQAGAEWWLPPFMSLKVFAGAAQFLAIGLLAADVPVSEIIAAVAIVNLRHIFYGISLRDVLPTVFWQRLYCIYALTDENYSLFVGLPKQDGQRFALGISALNHSYWVFSAALGAVLGKLVQVKINGIEFSLTALFTVLALEQYRRRKSPLLVFSAIASYGLGLVLMPEQPLFIAMCIGIVLTPVLPAGVTKARHFAAYMLGRMI